MAINVHETLDALLKAAKTERASYRYSEDERMGNTAIIIGPDDQRAIVPLNWKDAREKQGKMHVLSCAAAELHAQAIILITDTRWTKSDIFALHFGMKDVLEQGVEEFQKQYWAILSSMFDGQIKNLPRELWNEAVLVAIKGPAIEPQTRMASYLQGPNDDVVFTGDSPQSDQEMWKTELYVIPDWWKRP